MLKIFNKEFIMNSGGLWTLMGTIAGLLAAIGFGLANNWWAMLWALLAASWAAAATRLEYRLWQLETQKTILPEKSLNKLLNGETK